MAKDKFSELPKEFVDQMESSSIQELKEALGLISTNEELNLSAAKADEDLQKLREQVSVASKGYREGTKMNKIKTKFIRRILADKGDSKSAEIVALDVRAAG